MFIWQILSWYIVMLQCVDNKYFELLSAVNLSASPLCVQKAAVRVTGLIMQPLVDVLKWFGVEASGWSVSVCLFLLFLSLLYWWVKQFHHEVSNRKTHTLLFTDCNSRFLMTDVSNAFWEVSTTVRSKQLRLVFLRRRTARSDQIPITRVSTLIF